MNAAVFLAILFSSISGQVHAQILGDRSAQEKGDIVFRALGFPLNSVWPADYHSGVYVEYSDSSGGTGTPADLSLHSIIQMTGISGLSSLTYDFNPPYTFPYIKVVTADHIQQKTLQEFESAAAYWGAFTAPSKVLPRGSVSGKTYRAGIVEKAKQLKDRPSTILYAVDVDDPFWPNLLQTYAEASGSGATVAVDDISRMRSDAFVEYCYASLNAQILSQSIYSRAGLNMLRRWARGGGLTPKMQLTVAMPALTALPEISIFNGTTTIPSGDATSLTSLNITVYDVYSGPGRLELYKNGSLLAVNNPIPARDMDTYTYTSSDISQLGSLVDGQYTVRAIDQAGRVSESALTVSSGKPACGSIQDVFRNSMSSVIQSTVAPVFTSTGSIAGVCSVGLQDPYGAQIGISSFTASFDALTGPYPNLSTGTYTLTVVDCANNICQSTFSIVATTGGVTSCLSGGGGNCDIETASGTATKNSFMTLTLWTLEAQSTCGPVFPATVVIPGVSTTTPPGPAPYCFSVPGPQSTNSAQCFQNYHCLNLPATDTVYTISTTSLLGVGFTASVGITNSAGGTLASLLSTAPTAGWTIVYGTITVPQYGGTTLIDSADDSMSLASYFSGVSITSRTLTPSDQLAYLQLVLGRLGNAYVAVGSDFIYTSTTMVTLSTPVPSGVSVDTSTVRIYRYDGVTWSSAAITNQYVSMDSSGVVTATGATVMSGTYALLFHGADTSPPVTSFSIQGSSFIFNQDLFVSTDAYVVLSASDPVIGGYASTVASVTYRFDPVADTPFQIYSTSIPLSLGTHIFEYRSIDYSGNVETVKTATFTVTAGAAFKNTSDHRVVGSLLAGYLGSDAKSEIVSAAENDYTLLVTSVNRAAMVSASNIGSVGVGPQTPEGRLDVGQGNVAMGLRSGNATSTGTALQMTFGYNGDYSMRHALRTRHSTATDGNRMDFMLWSPAAGATTTVASVNVLSLQGISTANDGAFHVMPFGEPDAEVEVSNGSSLGGGTIQRQQVLTPSSRRFKSDIRYLDARQEDAALDEIAGMRHARFRYKSRDGRPQPLNVGLIYEEAPESIRAAEKTLSSVERVAEVEMALKAALRQLEALEKRHAELKARRRNP